MFSVSLKCRMGVIRRRIKGIVLCAALARAFEPGGRVRVFVRVYVWRGALTFFKNAWSCFLRVCVPVCLSAFNKLPEILL